MKTEKTEKNTKQPDINPDQIEKIVDLITDENFSFLYGRAQGINFFEISGMQAMEIKHSATIAWLMKPLENHGLGNIFIQKFLVKLRERNKEAFPEDKKNETLLNLLTDDAVDLKVMTEELASGPLTQYEEPENSKKSLTQSEGKERIDILAISKANQFVLCIENKVRSGFHNKQLDAYYNYVDEQDDLKGFKKFYVVLSPNGNSVSEKEAEKAGPVHYEEWLPISYGDIVEILKDIQETKDINQKVKIIIADYIDCLANNQVVEDLDLNKKLEDINSKDKHKDALDLIFDKDHHENEYVKNITTVYAKPLNLIEKYRKDSPTLLKNNYIEILKDIQKEHDEYGISDIDADKKYRSRSRLHITTHRMDRCLPPDINPSLGSFKDGRKYAYWSFLYENPPRLGLYITPSDFDEATISEMQRFIDIGKDKKLFTNKNIKKFDGKKEQETRVLCEWKSGVDPIDSYDKEKLKEALKDIFDKIKAWEEKMLSAFEKNKPAT